MLMQYVSASAVGSVLLAFLAAACSENASHVSQYAGQETRQITSLSADDVEELSRGGGWGLAKAAEFNGMPGPAHLLEMKDEIGLSAAQVAEITTIHDAMRAEAKTLGLELIDLEEALDAGFKSKSFTHETLQTALADLGSVRTKLRYAHLSAHLRTPALPHFSRTSRSRGTMILEATAKAETLARIRQRAMTSRCGESTMAANDRIPKRWMSA